jgi:hypothetical protein
MVRLFRNAGYVLLAFAALAALWPQPAAAVTPESREVRRAIDKGLKYLEENTDGRLGGKCLIGMCFLKDGKDESHPRVAEAVKACQAAATADAKAIGADIYSTGIAIIFLCTCNPSKYYPEIIKFRDSLEHRQKSHGGWGYADKPTGDTSMTQYAVLAYWEMTSAGIPTTLESTERVANWLLLTQAPEGNWGYQGKEGIVSGSRLDLEKQDSARPGMSCAGLGATYMCADLLGLTEVKAIQNNDLPPAMRPAFGQAKEEVLTNKVDPRHMRAAQSRGREWMRKNYPAEPPAYFAHYYLYALERYQSFLEAAEGRNVKEPTWYNDGFAYLRKNQEADGSWKGSTEGLDAVNTAFSVLFLLRSTKKAIERSKSFGDGALLAGRGVPGTQEIRVRGGQIVPKQVPMSTAELIETLAKPDSPTFLAVAADVDLLRERLATAEASERAGYLTKLRTLVATGVPEARLAAVKLLSRMRDLESVPALIMALDDPDWQVAVAADEGLQFIGRKINPGLGDKPDKDVRAAAVARWKQWYLAVRPDAEFEN